MVNGAIRGGTTTEPATAPGRKCLIRGLVRFAGARATRGGYCPPPVVAESAAETQGAEGAAVQVGDVAGSAVRQHRDAGGALASGDGCGDPLGVVVDH